MQARTQDAELLARAHRVTIRCRRAVDGALAGAYRSVFRGQGAEFEEVREFVEGDELRAVDWNVTARLGTPYVKTYVDERELTLLFVVDRDASMDAGTGPWTPREGAARLCATLGHSAMASHDRFGLLAFGAGVDTVVRPGRGVGHLLRIVREALTPSTGGGADPRAVLDAAVRLSPRRAIVFVVSDFLGVDETTALAWRRALGAAGRRHDVVAVPLMSPEVHDEAWAERAGRVALAVPGEGRSVVLDLGSRRVRRAYRERVEAWRETLDDVVRRAGVARCDVALPASPAEAAARDVVAESLQRFFGERMRRRVAR